MIEEITGDFLQWLRGFYFVADKESVTEASVAMRREQPTITHQIKCLEKELGVTLFDRSSGRMRLTSEGRVLFEKAISVFEIIKEMRSELGKEQLDYQGKIVIATSNAIIDCFLPRYLLKFRSTHPRVNIEMQGVGYEMVLGKVDSGEVDFGISIVNSFPDTIVYHHLFEAGVKLIAPKNNTFFVGKSPSLREIAKAPFIFFTRPNSISSAIEERFNRVGLKLNVVMIPSSYVSLKKYVALGIGVAIVSDLALSLEDEGMIDIFSLDRYFDKWRYYLLLRKKKYFSPAGRALLRIIKPDIQFSK
jgi:DNA-binding transcriptional LysR family regulator